MPGPLEPQSQCGACAAQARCEAPVASNVDGRTCIERRFLACV